MTIGVGIVCQHGMVLATDSEITTDTGRSDGDKAWYFTLPAGDPNPTLTVGLVGAGNLSYIVDAKEAIRRNLATNPTMKLDEAEDCIRAAIHDIHINHIYPIGEPHERFDYDIWLIIGIVAQDGRRLLCTDKTAVTPVDKFHHIGRGEELARFLVAQSGITTPSMFDAAFLSSQILVHANRHVRDVGGQQRIIVLYALGGIPSGWIEPDLIKRQEEFIRRFEKAAQPVMFGGTAANVTDTEFVERLEHFRREMMEARQIKLNLNDEISAEMSQERKE